MTTPQIEIQNATINSEHIASDADHSLTLQPQKPAIEDTSKLKPKKSRFPFRHLAALHKKYLGYSKHRTPQ